MKIEKITLGKTIQAGQFIYDRPGVIEATLEPGETMEEGLSELNKRLIEWHKREYPHLYQEEGIGKGTEGGIPLPADYVRFDKIGVINQSKTGDEKEHVKANIVSSLSIEYLSQWKILAGKHNLTTEYMNRLKELTK